MTQISQGPVSCSASCSGWTFPKSLLFFFILPKKWLYRLSSSKDPRRVSPLNYIVQWSVCVCPCAPSAELVLTTSVLFFSLCNIKVFYVNSKCVSNCCWVFYEPSGSNQNQKDPHSTDGWSVTCLVQCQAAMRTVSHRRTSHSILCSSLMMVHKYIWKVCVILSECLWDFFPLPRDSPLRLLHLRF